ncbi:hypothetical protein [Vibrio fluvialis]|uniref:hypothetical protein n=1 Tax=Vibrio fluvialis TaxID=676 RepID=UPI0023A97541|nr:hypothetical protein [Vibrio fluvialis]MDE5179137.1 hypothetical protein [Vibrio fluvialis]
MGNKPNKTLDDYATDFIKLGYACDYDGTIDSLMTPIVNFGDERSIIEITVGTLAMKEFARCVIKKLKTSFVYRIYDCHDFGDQSICVESFMPLEDIRDACRYINLKGEEILTQELGEEGISPSNFAIAAVLIAHFGCAATLNAEDAMSLERHYLSEGAGTFKDADSRFKQCVPSDLNNMMRTLRLFVANCGRLDSVNNHYEKYY